MLRGWIIFSTLTLSVLFRVIEPFTGKMGFLLTDKVIDKQSWVYYTMEHIIAIGVAACILIQDNTPRVLIQLFVLILIIDFVHYLLFFRDETVGFNLIKAIIFGSALLWIHLKRLEKT